MSVVHYTRAGPNFNLYQLIDAYLMNTLALLTYVQGGAKVG